MVAQAFNSITQEEEAADLCKFKVTLVYKVEFMDSQNCCTEKLYFKKQTKQKVTVMSHPHHYKILKHSGILTYLKITTDFLQG